MSNPELIDKFVALTGADAYIAEQFLSRNGDDLTLSIEDYFANEPEPQAAAEEQHTRQSGVRTLRDLNEPDAQDDKTNTNFFTGGEKSALQVEDPNKKKKEQSIIDKIFNKAREQMSEPDDRPAPGDAPIRKHFKGAGFKLGDGVLPSEQIHDPNSIEDELPQRVTREITFWKQGFTVGTGPLNRYDDPSNALVLHELNNGRVPTSILDVKVGQDVDVTVTRKTEEDYTPPKRRVAGFGGSGQRLGAPVPGESPVYEEEVTKKPVESIPTELESIGDSLVQIRFANGKRVAQKFNSTDPISTVYLFVQGHELNSSPEREFTLSHSFPVKAIDNSEEVTVADAKLKNSVIVQRWTS